jgi:hypothetical protein
MQTLLQHLQVLQQDLVGHLIGLLVLNGQLLIALHRRWTEAERVGAAEERRRLREEFAPPPDPRRDEPGLEISEGFFWRYAEFGDNMPCGHCACCYAAACPACAHGEIQQWTGKSSNLLRPPVCWFCLPMCIPCLIEKDRTDIEATIHDFHKQRGDPTAPDSPVKHNDFCIVMCFCPPLWRGSCTRRTSTPCASSSGFRRTICRLTKLTTRDKLRRATGPRACVICVAD